MAALIPGLGSTELVIILVIGLITSVLPAIGIYGIAQKAGYGSGATIGLVVGYLFVGWIVLLILGFSQWPRDQKLAPAYPPPTPPTPPTV